MYVAISTQHEKCKWYYNLVIFELIKCLRNQNTNKYTNENTLF